MSELLLVYGAALAILVLVSFSAALKVVRLRRDIQRLDRRVFDLECERRRIDILQRMHWHTLLALIEAAKLTPADVITRGVEIEQRNAREFEANRKASLQ